MRDMEAKGRRARGVALNHTPQVGEANHGAKLTQMQVHRVKELFASGMPQTRIARLTGVTKSNVWAIVHGQSWRHVT